MISTASIIIPKYCIICQQQQEQDSLFSKQEAHQLDGKAKRNGDVLQRATISGGCEGHHEGGGHGSLEIWLPPPTRDPSSLSF